MDKMKQESHVVSTETSQCRVLSTPIHHSTWIFGANRCFFATQ